MPSAEELKQLVRQMQETIDDSSFAGDLKVCFESDPAKFVRELQAAHAEFKSERDFQVGDLVCWKKGCKNKKFPEYGLPMIVVDIDMTPPRFGETDNAGSVYYYEPLDLQLACLDKEDDFVYWHYDKRRFEKYDHTAELSEPGQVD